MQRLDVCSDEESGSAPVTQRHALAMRPMYLPVKSAKRIGCEESVVSTVNGARGIKRTAVPSPL